MSQALPIKSAVIVAVGGEKIIVDAQSEEMLRARKWYINNTGYAMSSYLAGYGRRTVLMHRVVLESAEVCLIGMTTDHINGDKLDNRFLNLRAVTNAENQLNRVVRNRTGVRGVTRTKEGKWRAEIMLRGVRRGLGIFRTLAEAASARHAAEMEVIDAQPGLPVLGVSR